MSRGRRSSADGRGVGVEAPDQPRTAEEAGSGRTRRALLRDGGALALAVFVAPAGESIAVAAGPGRPRFLTRAELATLRGLVDRFVPGPPDDLDQGAVAARCAEAIDALLAAFEVDPPLIYAGGPFSDRAGSKRNHFKKFVPLDRYERKAWRLRIEGSRGKRELEFNGSEKGFRTVYREGLAALERAAEGVGFANLPGPARDVILRTSRDSAIDDLVDIAFPHTLEFMYGAPEYKGNRDLIGWRYTNYDGDVQPRGYTRKEIEEPDRPDLADGLPRPPDSVPFEQLLALAALASPEFTHGLVERSGGTWSGLREQFGPVVEAARTRSSRGG